MASERMRIGEHAQRLETLVVRRQYRSTFNEWQVEQVLKEAAYYGNHIEPAEGDRVTVEEDEKGTGFVVTIERLSDRIRD